MEQFLKVGEKLFEQGRLDEAAEFFLKIIKENPRSKEALNNLGVIAFHQNRFDSAREYIRQALEIDPAYNEALENLALVNMQPASQGIATPEAESKNPAVDFRQPLPKQVALVKDRKKFVVDFCRNKKVLHIGCVDSGLLEQRMAEKKYLHHQIAAVSQSLIGLDIDRAGIDLLRGQGYDVHQIDVTREPERLHEFCRKVEVIVIPEVLEHLDNVGLFLDHLHAADFSGDMLVSTPNSFSFRSFTLLPQGIEFVHPEHCYYFSPATLAILLRKHGFRISRLAMYYWPANDDFTREFEKMLKQSPYYAEGIIAMVRKAGAT